MSMATPIALANPTASVLPWLLIHRQRIERRSFASAAFPPAHRMATRLAVCWLVLITGLGLLEDATQNYFMGTAGGLCWAALAVTIFAALALLWDVGARDSVALLYVLGCVACGMLLDALNVTRPRLLWTGTMVAGAYAVLTSYLWSRRKGLLAFAERMGVLMATGLIVGESLMGVFYAFAVAGAEKAGSKDSANVLALVEPYSSVIFVSIASPPCFAIHGNHVSYEPWPSTMR